MSARTGQIARAAGIMMGAFVVSRVLGLAREAILAAQFGTNPEFGAYQAAFRVPDFLFNVIGAGAIGSAFIPVFAGYVARHDEEDAWHLASAIMNLMALLLVVGAGLAAVFAPQLTRTLIVPGYSPEEQALTANLVRIMLLSPVLFGLSGLMMAILNSYQHFLLPALSPIFYNLAIILGALVLAPRGGLGVRGVAAGVVLGSALHLGVQLPGLMRRRNTYAWTFGLRDAGVRRVAWLLAPRILGMAAVQINFVVNVNLASRLPEPAARVAALSYAWILMLLPEGLFALSIANAVFPTFSAQVARGEQAELRATLSGLIRLILFATIPASIGLFLLRTPLIQLLFQRGSFTVESTRLTAYALQFYALGLFAHSTIEIVTRAYYALHDTRTPVLVGVGTMVLNVVLSLLFIGSLQHGGLALANTLASIAEMVILVELMRRRLGGLDEARLVPSLLKTIGATVAMAIVLIAALLTLPAMRGALVALIGLVLGGGTFALAAFVFGAPEMMYLYRLVSGFTRRARPTEMEPAAITVLQEAQNDMD